jgi:hypothetical protein
LRRGVARQATPKRTDEAISVARDRLDEVRRVGRISQRVAQPLDGSVQAVLEVDERVVAPEATPEILAGDDLAGRLEQRDEDGEWLILQCDTYATLPQVARDGIQLEGPEAVRTRPLACIGGHRRRSFDWRPRRARRRSGARAWSV